MLYNKVLKIRKPAYKQDSKKTYDEYKYDYSEFILVICIIKDNLIKIPHDIAPFLSLSIGKNQRINFKHLKNKDLIMKYCFHKTQVEIREELKFYLDKKAFKDKRFFLALDDFYKNLNKNEDALIRCYTRLLGQGSKKKHTLFTSRDLKLMFESDMSDYFAVTEKNKIHLELLTTNNKKILDMNGIHQKSGVRCEVSFNGFKDTNTAKTFEEKFSGWFDYKMEEVHNEFRKNEIEITK